MEGDKSDVAHHWLLIDLDYWPCIALRVVWPISDKFQGNTEMYLLKQFIMAGLGLICMYACHRQNYLIYNKLALILFILAIPLFIYSCFGVEDR